jgi:hypothetical protein
MGRAPRADRVNRSVVGVRGRGLLLHPGRRRLRVFDRKGPLRGVDRTGRRGMGTVALVGHSHWAVRLRPVLHRRGHVSEGGLTSAPRHGGSCGYQPSPNANDVPRHRCTASRDIARARGRARSLQSAVRPVLSVADGTPAARPLELPCRAHDGWFGAWKRVCDHRVIAAAAPSVAFKHHVSPIHTPVVHRWSIAARGSATRLGARVLDHARVDTGCWLSSAEGLYPRREPAALLLRRGQSVRGLAGKECGSP